MNAGRDVERLIAGWLIEEAPARAPDRLLESTADVIDRTKQRRFGAAWREPVTLSIRTLLAAAAVIVIVAAGSAWIGRQTAVGGAAPSPSPASSADAASELATYQAARDAVCADLTARRPPDVTSWKTDPSSGIAFLTATVEGANEEITRLSSISAPISIKQEHLANIQTVRDVVALLTHEIELLQAGKPDEAITVDEATTALSTLSAAFEGKYALGACPYG